MQSATGGIVEGAEDLLSNTIPGLLAIGAAVPILGVIAGLAGKFYVTYLEAGVNQLEFKQLKNSVDYAVQQLAAGSNVVKSIQFPKGHVIFVSLRMLAVSIYEASVYIKKFTSKYASMQARMGNTDMDKREIEYAMASITRAIDNFRQDLTAYAATVTLRNEQVHKLRELLEPPGFDALMDSHRGNCRMGIDSLPTFLSEGISWIHSTSASASADADSVSAPTGRVLALEAEAGMGKSMFCTLFVDTLLDKQKSPHLRAQSVDVAPCVFFCRAGDPKRSSGAVLVRSLAFQLAHGVPDMEAQVLEAARRTVGENDPEELFEHLLLRPMEHFAKTHAVEVKRLVLLFVIDGINHLGADAAERQKLLLFLGKKLHALPDWVRVVVTCTPEEPGFEQGLAKGAKRMSFTRDNPIIAAELRRYIGDAFALLVTEESELSAVTEVIFERSHNSFTYTLYAIDEVRNSDFDRPRWTLIEIQTMLPLVYSNDNVNKLMELLRRKDPKLFAKYQADGLNLLTNVSDTLAEGVTKLGGMFSGLKAKISSD